MNDLFLHRPELLTSIDIHQLPFLSCKAMDNSYASRSQTPLGLQSSDLLATAQNHDRQPLCGDSAGWGPFSSDRWDFTPCFMDFWVTGVATYGILFGLGAIWWLLRRNKARETAKDWHFWSKLGIVSALALTTSLEASLLVEYLPGIWLHDFRFWTPILTLLSLIVIGVAHYLEHERSRVPNGVILFYWLFFIVAYAVKTRSLVSRGQFEEQLPYAFTFTVSFGLAVLELALEWLVPKRRSAYDRLEEEQLSPIEFANVFSVLTFSWVTPMMKYGYHKYLTEDDLWPLRTRDQTGTTSAKFESAWQKELDTNHPSLWIAMFRAFWAPYFRAAIFKTFHDVLQFVQPQLLRLMITWVDSYRKEKTPEPVAKGAAIALGMLAVATIQTTMLHQYFQRAFETGMRIKSSLTAAIYRKTMVLSNEARASQSTGQIVNLMAVDSQRLQDLTQYGQQLYSAPLQIILCMASLYQLVGISMLAGVGVMLVMIPINGLIARIMKGLQKTQMKNKDSRTRLMTEILNNMKSIKLYAWTTAYMAKLNYVRNQQELKTLQKIGAASALANFTWSTTPFLVSCLTFAVFVMTNDRPLSSDLVFPALALFNLLTFPLAMLPMVISAIVEATVAVERLTAFFRSNELQSDAIIIEPEAEDPGDETVSVIEGSFSWGREAELRLKDINYIAKKGELNCIVGRVGAGKSSLLLSLLGDMYKHKGTITLHGKVAYVAQQPWVMNASVKDNVTFGYRWDAQFYEQTMQACGLKEDLDALPDGDDTEVGERGISLSGGQKARLTLARAVYARADIYLLDDILSAVDQHVGRHIINEVLGQNGLLATKTRILATNSIPVLREADHVCLIQDGSIIETGTYAEAMATDGLIRQIVFSSSSQDQSGAVTPEDDDAQTIVEDVSSSSIEADGQEAGEAVQEGHDTLAPIKPVPTGCDRKVSLRRASSASFHGPRGKLLDEETGGRRSDSKPKSKEHVEQGKVRWDVYFEYAKAANLPAVAIYLMAMISAQILSFGGSFWLKHWAEVNDDYGGNPDVGKYIGIYFAFGVGGAGVVVVQTLILWILCSIHASKNLHERMAHAIFRSPMSFFDTTPTGRILNRFSSDIYRVDEVLARTFNMLFASSARSMFTLILIAYPTPAFIALIIPLLGLYLFIQRYYLRTSRELKRLDSVTKSPIYAHFQETLGGLSTIRAYRQQRRFERENEWRMDANLRAYFPSINANRWLAVRLEFIGSIIIFAAAALAVISVWNGSKLSASLVGLTLSYALQITQSLNWIVRQTVEVETNIVSVERVLEYARLPSEAPETIAKRRPAASWPAEGAVDFFNYSTKYREGLDNVLKNISLDIKPHEKIGIVGRTGAGKSSLTLALYRLIEPTSGRIAIDNVDISKIGLMDLRQRLAIIPQDAAIFEGSVRDNLDPNHIHDDTELWDALQRSRLRDHISKMDGGLDAKIYEGGSNLSSGQRQLVSLARAVLTPSNILVLDEATAAVDVETDAALQQELRGSIFKYRTIITIAHRINTIMDSDRIVVLKAGEIQEFDTPSALLKKKGLFYDLAKEAGLAGQAPSDETE